MTIRNTPETYGRVAKTLHWLIAIAVLVMMLGGTFMEDIPDQASRYWVYGIHKSLGIAVLFLMLARLLWKAVDLGYPHPNPTHKPWEQKLSGLVHWGFYALLIVMPLSGWLMSSAAGYPFRWFGTFSVPLLLHPDKGLQEVFFGVHEFTATLIWIALALHVGGALKHVFIDRDNTLKRMLPVLALVLLTAMPAHAVDVPPTPWLILRDQSKLSFDATQEGSAFQGEFAAFDGTIVFDPKDPQKGTAHVLIDLGSMASGNAERDKTVIGHDWFDTDTNPTATFAVDYFDKGDKDGDYIARGRLILRGIEKALDLPFKLTIVEKDGLMTARATGEATIKRLDFGVGEGQWANTATVGDAVVVKIDIAATKRTDAD